MITMQNDNDSKPMSEERLRHTARYETMGDVLEYLRSDPAVSPQDCGAGWQPIETAPLVPYKRFLIGRLIGARFDWVATAERRELDTVWGRWDSGKLSTTYRPTHWMEMPALVPKGAA